MSKRIAAILRQEYYLLIHRLEIIVDLFWFSVLGVITFGFISNFLTQGQNEQAANYILAGLILWEVIRVGQYSLSVGPLWNIWSGNLTNLFRTPLSIWEYILALIISATLKCLLVLSINLFFVLIFFKFNLLALGLPVLIFSFINLSIFAWSLGIMILGFIFLFGTRIQALSWGFVFVIQPLTAVFFPVSILPAFLQKIAYMLPSTYIFEGSRAILAGQTYPIFNYIISFSQNILYFTLALVFFRVMYQRSRQTGQFAKNDED